MQPSEKFRQGLVSAAVFEREQQGPNGEFMSRSVALQIGYKNKEGDFVNNSLTVVKGNIDNVIAVLQDAKAAIANAELASAEPSPAAKSESSLQKPVTADSISDDLKYGVSGQDEFVLKKAMEG